AALEATRRLAPGEMLAGLLDLVANAHTPEEKELARLAAIAAATRVADRNAAATTVAERLKTWPTPERGILLDMLRAIGGAQSLELVAVAAQAPERDTQDHATRVLGAWPTSDAAPVLLNLANSNHPFSARALRGYLRIARQLNVGEEERIAMCRRALEIANRDDARLLALSILELSPSKTSLELAASQLASDKLGPQASEAVINIAEAVAAGDPGAAQAAARQVVEVGAGDEVLARAHKLAAP
ncbi:MAG: hypothetical protein KDA44_10210, partial [Planctomycetales bacterium]|nr:hypothetical protein [Planctomycetales bacterium]